MISNAAPRRRIAVLATTAAAGGLALVATTLVASPAANAAGHPDLKITQRISGSTTKGHTFDTITIKNHGTASASSVNIQLYTTTTSAFTDVFVGGAAVCEVMPAPKGYPYATACQITGSIAAGKSVSLKGDFGGTAGVKFTNLATVGEFQGDASYTDNRSSVTSWFGPRADLAVSGTAKPGTKKGHLTAVTTVVNHGPNNAVNIQEVVEVKNLNGALGSGTTGSCQTIPPATGYQFAFSCVRSSLNTGQAWKITFDYTGTSGKTATMKTTVTSQTKDPYTKNNAMTKTATVR